MKTVALTDLARDDLRHIGRYTERVWGRRQKVAYMAGLRQAFHALASEAMHGAAFHPSLPRMKRHLVGRHVIFFMETKTELRVVRVLHAQMDHPRHLG